MFPEKMLLKYLYHGAEDIIIYEGIDAIQFKINRNYICKFGTMVHPLTSTSDHFVNQEKEDKY